MASMSISRHVTPGCSTASFLTSLKKRPSVTGRMWRLPTTVIRPRRYHSGRRQGGAGTAVRRHADFQHVKTKIEIKTPVRSFQYRQGRIRYLRSDIVSGEHRDFHFQDIPKSYCRAVQANARTRMKSIAQWATCWP